MTRSFIRFRFGLLAALLLILVTARPSYAQVDEAKLSAARTLGYEGIKAYEANNFAEATDKLERAYSLVKAPIVGLWSARALVKTGKLVSASERYLEVTRLPLPETNKANHEAAQRDAATELEQLQPRIPSVTITITGAEGGQPSVTIDGKPLDAALIGVAAPVDPGKHVIEAKVGDVVRNQTTDVAEGQKASVVLNFTGAQSNGPGQPLPPPPPDQTPEPTKQQPILAYVALGVGGVGLIVGGVTGFMAMGKKSDLEKSEFCQEDECGPEKHSDVDSLNTLRTVSTIGFAIGLVGTSAGVALLLTDKRSEAKRKRAPRVSVGLGNVSFGGRF